MRLSVALCTFNGERFLPEQLASIAGQTRPPDELIICDDASTDRTPDLLKSFAGAAPFPVRLEVNSSNVGSTCNFARAIRRCTGDVIALADQDDVWLPHKLAALERSLASAPGAGFTFSDAEMVDEELRPIGYTLWDALRFRSREQRRYSRFGAFDGLLKRYRVTGATMAFRSAFRDLVLPIPPEWTHDAWIALLISAVAGCALVPEPLIRYRQHGQQQLGKKKHGLVTQFRVARGMTRETFEGVAARYAAAAARLRGVPAAAGRLDVLDRKVEHFRRRVAMRDSRWGRLPMVVGECWRGHYSRYSHGWKSAAQDLFL